MALRKMFALSDANIVVRYLISTLNKPFLTRNLFIAKFKCHLGKYNIYKKSVTLTMSSNQNSANG